VPLLIAVVLVVAVMLLIGWLRDHKVLQRARRLQQQAEALGYAYLEKGDARLAQNAGRFLLFTQGREGSAANLLRRATEAGTAPVAELFDYTFLVSFGRYDRAWQQSVVRLTDASLDLPPFSLVPEAVLDAMLEHARDPDLRERLIGTAGIRFRDHPQFAKQMSLQSPDRRSTRALFGADLIAYLEDRPDLCLEAAGPNLLLYRFDTLLPPEDSPTFLDEALTIHALISSPATEVA